MALFMRNNKNAGKENCQLLKKKVLYMKTFCNKKDVQTTDLYT